MYGQWNKYVDICGLKHVPVRHYMNTRLSKRTLNYWSRHYNQINQIWRLASTMTKVEI